MTWTLGRLGSDISLRDPSKIEAKGDELTLGGFAQTTSAVMFAAIKQNLRGLKNEDEPIVPFALSSDTSYDGFYEVLDVSYDTSGPLELNRWVSYTISLRRIDNRWQYPRYEQILRGAARTGKPGGITPRYWTAYPSTWAFHKTSTGNPSAPTGAARITVSSGGSLYIIEHADLADATVASYPPATTTPWAYYVGAPKLKLGSTLYTQIGRQALFSTNLELSNGLLTLTEPSTTTYALGCSFTTLAGGAPTVTTHQIEVGYVTAGPVWNNLNLTAITSVEIVRNAPEEVVIKITYSGSAGHLTVSMRRGDRGVHLSWYQPGTTQLWGFAWQTGAAAAAIDANNAGVVDSAADADGAKRILVAAGTITLGTGASRIYRSGAATTFEAYAGAKVDTSSPDTDVWLQEAYMAAMSEQMLVTL